MKTNGIIRRVDGLGRIVIPKEIRRTLRIKEGDPLHTTLTSFDLFLHGCLNFTERIIKLSEHIKSAANPLING